MTFAPVSWNLTGSRGSKNMALRDAMGKPALKLQGRQSHCWQRGQVGTRIGRADCPDQADWVP